MVRTLAKFTHHQQPPPLKAPHHPLSSLSITTSFTTLGFLAEPAARGVNEVILDCFIFLELLIDTDCPQIHPRIT